MSAIIAGKACKECGQEYYISFGHPKWYDDVVKRNLPPSDDYKAFRKFQTSGKCPNCYLKNLPDNDWRKAAIDSVKTGLERIKPMRRKK